MVHHEVTAQFPPMLNSLLQELLWQSREVQWPSRVLLQQQLPLQALHLMAGLGTTVAQLVLSCSSKSERSLLNSTDKLLARLLHGSRVLHLQKPPNHGTLNRNSSSSKAILRHHLEVHHPQPDLHRTGAELKACRR